MREQIMKRRSAFHTLFRKNSPAAQDGGEEEGGGRVPPPCFFYHPHHTPPAPLNSSRDWTPAFRIFGFHQLQLLTFLFVCLIAIVLPLRWEEFPLFSAAWFHWPGLEGTNCSGTTTIEASSSPERLRGSYLLAAPLQRKLWPVLLGLQHKSNPTTDLAFKK